MGDFTRRAFWITGLVLALAWALAPVPPAWVETVYSRGLYRAVAAVVIPLGDWTDLPLGIPAVLLAAAAWLGSAVRRWVRGRRRGVARARLLLGGTERFVGVAVGVYLAFLVLWGAGYRRVPIEERLGLAPVDPGGGASAVEPEEARELFRRVLTVLEESAAGIGESPTREDAGASIAALRRSMRRVVEAWEGVEPRLPRRVKRLPAGTLIASGTTGVTFPLLLEAHVDGALPAPAFVAVAAHELAHVAGRNGEAEAELLGVAAGLAAEEPLVRYGVALLLSRRVAALLPRDERSGAIGALPERARRDLAEIDAVFDRHRVRWLARSQRAVYDGYLRSQRVAGGVADYSRATRLVVAAHRRGLLFPAPDGADPVTGDGHR